jgi:hypothetical protein
MGMKNILGALMEGAFDAETKTRETIEACLIRIAVELACHPKELFIMIKPTTDFFNYEDEAPDNFKCWIYHLVNGQPKLIREITLAEILKSE